MWRAPAAAACAHDGLKIRGRIGDAGQDGRAAHAHGQARCAKFAHGFHSQIWARSSRLENPRQFDVQGGHGDMNRQRVILRDCAQKIDIADDEIGFGDDPQLEATMARELFENAARDFVAALGRLVRIGCGAERNGFARLDRSQFVPQQVRGVLLDVDLLLELRAVAHFHEFVGVAGIAVLAGEFATSVGIDGPGEGHPAAADAAVQQGFRRRE